MMEAVSMSGFVADDVEIPEAIQLLTDGDTVRPIWRNGDGGVTYQIGAGDERRFVKWAPADSPIDLSAEAERLRWAVDFVRVPRVLGLGETESGTYLVTAGLPGESTITDHWKAHPDVAVRAAGAGLRAFHDALPVESCRFDWSVEIRLDRIATAGNASWQSPHPPSIDRLVVCHGDACVPNTLIDSHGGYAGHVDLGSLGRADRWADIAVATWSTEWNYGPGWERTFLDAYDVAPDEERISFYRALWDQDNPI